MTDFDPSFAWKLSGVPRLDWPTNVIARQNQPPESASQNDCYIVGEHPKGEWREKANQIAIRTPEGAWTYEQPAQGRRTYVRAIKRRLEFTGKKWINEATGLPPGGATGTVLTKLSPADNDCVWSTVSGGGGGGGGIGPIKLAATSEYVTGTDPEGTVFLVMGNSPGSYYERGAIYEKIGDFWTLRGSLSQTGIPQGGSTGQVLAKTSSSNFAVAWVNPDAASGDITSVVAGTGLTGGGTVGDVTLNVTYGTSGTSACVGNDSRLTNDRTASGLRSSSTVVAVSSATAPSSGQALIATSSTTATWQDLPGGDITGVTAGNGLTGGGVSGTVALAVSFGTTGTSACVGNDSRLSDSRTPGGTASGDLAGTYPSPNVAAVHSGATQLTIGTIVDGEFLQRSGTTIASAAGASAPQPVQVDGTLIGTRNAIDIVSGTGIFVSGSDDSSNNRVRVTVSSTGGGGGGSASNPYTDAPSSPDSFNDEFDSGSADLATRGYTVKNQSGTTLTRAGNIQPWSSPSAGTYYSTLQSSWIFIQAPNGDQIRIIKSISLTAGDTYYARIGSSTIMAPGGSGRFCEVGLYANSSGNVDDSNRVFFTMLETATAGSYISFDCFRTTGGSNSGVSRNAFGSYDIRGIRYESGTSHWHLAVNSNSCQVLSNNVTGAPAAANLVYFAIRYSFTSGAPGLLALDFVRKKTSSAWLIG